MSEHWYTIDSSGEYVLVQTGQPQDSVRVGQGRSYRAAREDLTSTQYQSTGPDSNVGNALCAVYECDDLDWLTEDDGPRDDKRSVDSWDAVASYVVTYPDGESEGACDVTVEIGETDGGRWVVRTRDDAGGEDDADDTTYQTERDAREAADALADAQGEGAAGEDASAYLTRQLGETAGEPSDDGEWCVYWETVLDDAGPRERYETREQAEAAAALADAELRASHPGSLRCAFAVRGLVNGQWVRTDDLDREGA